MSWAYVSTPLLFVVSFPMREMVDHRSGYRHACCNGMVTKTMICVTAGGECEDSGNDGHTDDDNIV